jgi:hypothetical protein
MKNKFLQIAVKVLGASRILHSRLRFITLLIQPKDSKENNERQLQIRDAL